MLELLKRLTELTDTVYEYHDTVGHVIAKGDSSLIRLGISISDNWTFYNKEIEMYVRGLIESDGFDYSLNTISFAGQYEVRVIDGVDSLTRCSDNCALAFLDAYVSYKEQLKETATAQPGG